MKKCARVVRPARFLAVGLVLGWSLAGPAAATERILLAGDSWALLLSLHRSLDNMLVAQGLTGIETVAPGTAIGGTFAADWATPEYLQKIDDAIAAYPTIDVVHLSLGINDLAWTATTLTKVSRADREAYFEEVATNTATVVAHILNAHPNVQVMLGGWDYLNFVDFLPWFERDEAWATQTAANWAFAWLDERRAEIAATDPRVHHVGALGLMQFLYGDSTREVPRHGAPWPGGFPFLPSPAKAMNDFAHLTQHGYDVLAWWHVFNFYEAFFTPGP